MALLMCAPEGESGWTIVELQGTVEPKTGSLDGLQFGQLSYADGVTPFGHSNCPTPPPHKHHTCHQRLSRNALLHRVFPSW